MYLNEIQIRARACNHLQSFALELNFEEIAEGGTTIRGRINYMNSFIDEMGRETEHIIMHILRGKTQKNS